MVSGAWQNLSSFYIHPVTFQCIPDTIQSQRLGLLIDGGSETAGDGLLDLISNSQTSDSCRAYQAVKCLVTASSKSQAVKEKLLQDPTKWQHSVNWLKSKMSETSSSFWNNESLASNEDSSSRTFQRTTSAQVTLDEAKAIFADFDNEKDAAMDTNNDDNDDNSLFNIDP